MADVYGTSGDDEIITLIPDAGGVLHGLGGNDTLGLHLVSGEGTVAGGEGDDLLLAWSLWNTKVFGGAGTDTFQWKSVAELYLDARVSTTSIESFFGGVGDDTILGGKGDETISGGLGFDRLEGRGGNDVLWSRAELMSADEGGNLYGGAGDDSLHGGNGYGGKGDDYIADAGIASGGVGDDVLFRNSHNKGGVGADTFVIQVGFHVLVADFAPAEDRIDLTDFETSEDALSFVEFERPDGSMAVRVFVDDAAVVTLRGDAATGVSLDDFIF